jgi:hypothetical protein
MAQQDDFMTYITINIKFLLSWVAGTSTGVIITIDQLGQSFMSIVTSCCVAIFTYFITRFLQRNYPTKKIKE